MDRNENMELFQAILTRDSDAVEQLVEAGANVNAHGDDGISVLCKAVYYLPVETVEFLIESGADVNVVSKNRLVPLKTAVVRGDPALVELLLEHGADVNARDDSGISPLMQAAVDGKTEIARILIENGADTGLKTQSGKTAALLAAEFGHTDIVRLLETGSDEVSEEEEPVEQEEFTTNDWRRNLKSGSKKNNGYKIPLIIALSATALIVVSLLIYNGKKKAYAFEKQKQSYEFYLSSFKFAEQKLESNPTARNREQVRVYRDRIENFVEHSDPRIEALWENYKKMHGIDPPQPAAATTPQTDPDDVPPALPPTTPQSKPAADQQVKQTSPKVTAPAEPAAPKKKHEHQWFNVTRVESWDVLNIRSRADYRSAKLGTIPHNGTCVKNLHQTQYVGKYLWIKIRYSGVTGWVNSHFLKPAKNCP